MFFYQKAMEESDDQLVNIDDFRYDGRRPRSKESAIIMLADTVEAAVRAMQEPTPKTIRANIEKLLSHKIQDGQLSQAPITLSDIDKISEAFATVLNGVFHERIEYPEPLVKRSRLRTVPKPNEDDVVFKPLSDKAKAAPPAPAADKSKDNPSDEADLDKKQ